MGLVVSSSIRTDERSRRSDSISVIFDRRWSMFSVLLRHRLEPKTSAPFAREYSVAPDESRDSCDQETHTRAIIVQGDQEAAETSGGLEREGAQVLALKSRVVPNPAKMMLAVHAASAGGKRSARAKARATECTTQ